MGGDKVGCEAGGIVPISLPRPRHSAERDVALVSAPMGLSWASLTR